MSDRDLLTRIETLESELRSVRIRLWVLDGKQTPPEVLEMRQAKERRWVAAVGEYCAGKANR